ncbi:MAG: hypothetical protein IH899_20770 [Planctomycetes bacterium]|nr:hypothetical protein [Planctomycetota bacterium]
MAAALMVVILAFTAFTVDLGYIALTKTQLQAAADGSVLAAGLEMGDGFGATAVSASTVLSAGAGAAQSVAAVHKNGDLSSTYLNTSRDIRFGTLSWNGESHVWRETWGASPYNLVEVTLVRGQNNSTDSETGTPLGDQQLPLFFGPIIGNSAARVSVSAKAALLPAAGISVPPGGTAPVLPMAVDLASWEDLMNNIGSDNYSYDPNTGSVTSGSDGIMELNIFPDGDAELPPGNRGTVSFGDPGDNSTGTLERQIVEGLNAYDMSFYTNNEISLDGGPFEVYGNPGISAGIEDELISVIGQFRIAALFTTAAGNGSNTTYTVVRWVASRIMAVDFGEKPKYVYVQPASFVMKNAVRVKGGDLAEIRDDTIFAPLFLYK